MELRKENNKGITLIALIITVIVLLILATITIATLTGEDGGIIDEATRAEHNTEVADEKEIIEASLLQTQMYNEGNVIKSGFKESLEENSKKNPCTLEGEGPIYTITFEKSGRVYTVDAGGEIDYHEEETGDTYFIWNVTSTESIIIGLKDKAKSLETVVIPNTYMGKPVTKIEEEVYFSEYAKYGMAYGEYDELNTKLKKVVIPENLVSIGEGTFSYCPNLKEIEVDENNTTYKDINGVLFSKDGTILMQYPYSKKGTEYTIPNGVEKIGEYAFSSTKLEEINLDEQIKEIEYGAFLETDFVKSTTITIPEFIDDMSLITYLIWDFENLEEIKVDKNNETFKDIDGILYSKDEKILYKCPLQKNITEYTISDKTETIYYQAFLNQKNLKTVTMGSSVKEIQLEAFRKVKSLRTVNLNYGIVSIGSQGFFECTIQTINIPSTLKSIGDRCFYDWLLSSSVKSKIKAINPNALYSTYGIGGASPQMRHVYNY